MTDQSVIISAMSTVKRTAAKDPASRRRSGNSPAASGPGRAKNAPARREAILEAALDEFSTRGFAAARLDDIASRAGVAKGTIYLYFKDKETLLQELIRSGIGPVVGTLEAAFSADLPLRAIVEHAIEVFLREVYGTDRKRIIRLIITEGPLFPEIADFYYREMLSRMLKAVRALLWRAYERGELPDDTLVRFPQLLVAPGVVAIVWSGLFDRFEPLDVHALMRAHLNYLFGTGRPA